jgi:hypothetical protein
VFEKAGPAGQRGVRPIGLGLIALGILVLADPAAPPSIPDLMAKGAPNPPGGWRYSTRPELLILDQATPAPMSKRAPSRPT